MRGRKLAVLYVPRKVHTSNKTKTELYAAFRPLGPTFKKPRNFSGLFFVLFKLYLGNAEVLSHQISQSSKFFLL